MMYRVSIKSYIRMIYRVSIKSYIRMICRVSIKSYIRMIYRVSIKSYIRMIYRVSIKSYIQMISFRLRKQTLQTNKQTDRSVSLPTVTRQKVRNVGGVQRTDAVLWPLYFLSVSLRVALSTPQCARDMLLTAALPSAGHSCCTSDL